MKKTPKKLVLAKETVRRLEDSDLGEVAGATDRCGSGNIGCLIADVVLGTSFFC
jgi:hypothetical protein